MNRPYTAVVVVAAGKSVRMKGETPKLFINLHGNPVLFYTLMSLHECSCIDEIVIVTRKDFTPQVSALTQNFNFFKISRIGEGGETRMKSVLRGLEIVSEKTEFVAIHDGARPFPDVGDLEYVIKTAYETGAAALASKITDTIKKIDTDNNIICTLDRETLVAVQTPQVFRYNEFKIAITQADSAGLDLTDDCQIYERLNKPVKIVLANHENIKVTTQNDIEYLNYLKR